MKLARKDIHTLEIALANYKSMWVENKSLSGTPSNSTYIDMNIAEFGAVINKIKSENI